MPSIIRSHVQYTPKPKPPAPKPTAPIVVSLRSHAWEWTKDELELVVLHYDRMGPQALAAHMKRTPQAIYHKAHEMGLRGPGRGRKTGGIDGAAR